ncbi:ferritin-like domain-containing protein [Candidatus Enterococcus courvalinii]|uniref:DNA-binding protein n=1 Tax=Candidatus Enterococcus courvalinii TaxID=2815329 RepID=A0ABS3I1T5_9ENTE|nr:ferritin-like domain-containing protein [Enterococcus sp. MSG2901]MBO0482658.1 DNA-binding protein [Enterococcus sp. MSG2901]
MNPTQKYEQEKIQSEQDHHTPTAAAMISHILSNLVIHRTKLKQARAYLKGNQRGYLETKLPTIIVKEDELFDELSQLVLDEGELIPTTTAEFVDYAMIKESGQLKYESAEKMLTEMVTDFATQKLFVTRGIVLAEKEGKYGLAEWLKGLYAWLNHQLYTWQSYLGKDIQEGLMEEE